MVPVLNCGMLRYPMTESLAAGASVYIGEGLTGYDACYAALAEKLKGKWLTFDDKAHKAIEKYNVSHLASMDLPDEFMS
jgi:predicted nucleic acid-binding protein